MTMTKRTAWRQHAMLQASTRAKWTARRAGLTLSVTVWKDGRIVAVVERRVPHAGGVTHDVALCRAWDGSKHRTVDEWTVAVSEAQQWAERAADGNAGELA